MKTCSRCGLEKSWSAFYKAGPGGEQGRRGACKDCTAPRKSRLRRRAAPLPHDIDNRVIKVKVCDPQCGELLRRILYPRTTLVMAVWRRSEDPLRARALRSLVKVLPTEPRRLGFRGTQGVSSSPWERARSRPRS
jgi:hypothetical protein